MNPAAPTTAQSLSKSELPALTNQALEADLIQISTTLLARGWLLATAESCTGGMIAAACPDLAGSSQWFERGFVTYSNEAKTELVGVPAGLIATHGAVSEPVAHAMALGAVAHSRAQAAVAVTGIAGPTGGTADKPVGTVWFGWNVNGNITTATRRFDGDRTAVRQQTLAWAFARLNALLQTPPPAPR